MAVPHTELSSETARKVINAARECCTCIIWPGLVQNENENFWASQFQKEFVLSASLTKRSTPTKQPQEQISEQSSTPNPNPEVREEVREEVKENETTKQETPAASSPVSTPVKTSSLDDDDLLFFIHVVKKYPQSKY